MYRACGYYRVSSESTHEEKLAVKKYKQALSREGIRKNDIFHDFSSGGNSDRPGYQKMMMLLKEGRYNLLATPMQSRLNRNVLNSEILLGDLEAAGAKLKILSNGQIIDPSDSNDRLTYRLHALIDNSKLDEIKSTSRANAKFKRLRKEAVSSAPFGYKIVKRKFELDSDPYVCTICDRTTYSPADVLKLLIDKVFELKKLSKAIAFVHDRFGVQERVRVKRRTAKQFNFHGDVINQYRRNLKFSFKGTKTLLSNPLLKGDLVYFWRDGDRDTISYPGEYKNAAIISPQDWDVLQLLKSNPCYGEKKIEYPYTGIIYCSHCQGRYRISRGHLKKDGTRRPSYYCNNSGKRGCKGQRIYLKELDEAVIGKLRSRYQEITQLALPNKNYATDPKIQKLLAQISSLESLEQNDTIKDAIAKTKLEIQQIIQKKTQNQKIKEGNVEILKTTFANPLFWESLSMRERKEVNLLLIDRIEIATQQGDRYGSVFQVLLKV